MAYVFEVNGVLYKYCVNVVSALRRKIGDGYIDRDCSWQRVSVLEMKE